MKTIYYYQSFCGLEKLFQRPQDISVIIVSSIHFGSFKNEPYIHLNNNHPNSPVFDTVWEELTKLYYQGVTITAMIGGAGGAYEKLFSDFDTFYPLLKKFLKEKNYITGVDLDIEENVSIDNVKKLINRLIDDFGEDFIITMAPVSSTMIYDSTSIAGFSYKELYKSLEGRHIKWFNTQCYGCFNSSTYDKIIKNGYPPEKIVIGMISGDFSNNFNEALNEVKNIKNTYPTFSGVYNWEYIDSPPNTSDPSEWCKEMNALITTVPIMDL